MNKRKLNIVICIMGFALLGLVAFQTYYLGEVMQAKEAQFSSQVEDSIDQVVRKLEKEEMVAFAQRKQEFEKQKEELKTLQNKLALKKDTKPKTDPNLKPSNRPLPFGPPPNQEMRRFSRNRRAPQTDFFVAQSITIDPFGNIIREEFHGQSVDIEDLEEEMQNRAELNQLMNQLANRNFPNRSRIPNEIPKAKNTEKEKPNPELERMLKKAALAEEVFADFLFKERPIQDRLSPDLVRKSLEQMLASKGIQLPFEFAIAKDIHQPDSIIYSSNKNAFNPKLKTIFYKTSLFPNDLHPTNYFLYLSFPNQKSFIIQAMGSNFISALLLLSVIIGSFFYAIQTIIKQKKLAEIKNDFINNMTHEFKTPISSISLASQLISEDQVVNSNDSLKKFIGIIQTENQRLGKQVEKVLQTAQMEKEEIVLNKKELNLVELIQILVEAQEPIIQAKGGNFELNLPNQPIRFMGDETHISNAILNLIDNAIKYSEGQPLVQINLEENEKEIIFSIKDSGIGIASQNIPYLFDAFYRVPTGNLHNVKGFGLGLSYVKKIMDIHKGKIEVMSKLKEGSQFIIHLPKSS